MYLQIVITIHRKLSGDKSSHVNGEIEMPTDVILRRVCRPTLMSPPSRSPLASSDHSNDAAATASTNGSVTPSVKLCTSRIQMNTRPACPVMTLNSTGGGASARKKKRHAFLSLDHFEDQLGEISDSIGDINTSLRSLSDVHNPPTPNIQSSSSSSTASSNHHTTTTTNNNNNTNTRCTPHNNNTGNNNRGESCPGARINSFFKYISDTVSTFPDKDILDIMNSVYNIVYNKEMDLLNS